MLGSMVHEGLAAYHQELRNGKTTALCYLMPVMQSVMVQNESQRPITYKSGETRDSLIAQGEALVDLYLNEPPPDNILAVEQPLVVPLVTSEGKVLDKPLVAVLDLLTDLDGTLLITEFKTSAKKYSDADVESALQASCYIHAVQERYEKPAQVSYTVLVKTKTPSIQKIETQRDQEDCTRIGDIVHSLETISQSHAFFPNESPMNCSGCSYRQECRRWTGTGTVARKQLKETAAC